jgi:hypothetical protein
VSDKNGNYPQRQLALDADEALHKARELLRSGAIFHNTVKQALRQSEIATAKLTFLETQFRGIPVPKKGETYE